MAARSGVEPIVIVNSKLLKRHSKAKRRAPAYSRENASNQRGFPKNSLCRAVETHFKKPRFFRFFKKPEKLGF